MDFRQCPACSASVLDDDAAECPFCGASMSGKPPASAKKPSASKKPAAPKSSGSKTTAPAKSELAKSEPAKRQPMRKVGETVADEDNPFGIDTSTVTEAPKVAPKPSKGRMTRVVCPMCETPGFIPKKLQGREVKCCNADCMVPVFKAPAPPKEEDEEEAASGPITMKRLGIASAIIVPLALLIFWGFFLRGKMGGGGNGNEPGGGTYQYPEGVTGGDSPAPTPSLPDDGGPARPKTLSLAEIKRQALAGIIKAAQLRDDNRKPYGRRQAAEAYAQVGDLKTAGEQLAHLRKVGSRSPSYQVEPLLLIAWRQFRDGDTAGGQASVEQAMKAYTKLPSTGRDVLTAAISLAATHAAFDKTAQAKQTLRATEPPLIRARTAAFVQMATHFGTYDIDALLKHTSLDLSNDPLAVASATEIAHHDLWEKAIVWAKAQSDVAAQDDCLAALAMLAAYRAGQDRAGQGGEGDVGPLALLSATTASLSPTGQVRVKAGVATGHLMRGNEAEAKAALTEAVALFDQLAKPTAQTTPSLKMIHNSSGQRNAGLPSESPLRSAAIAAAQIARLQQLTGDKATAWTTLLKAWDFTAGIAPNYGDISALNDELLNNQGRMDARLKQELRVRNRDEKLRVRNQFRRQLRDFDRAARQRYDIEVVLLTEAIGWGLLSEVGSVLQNTVAVIPSSAGQPYRKSTVVQSLQSAFAQTTEGVAKAKLLGEMADKQQAEVDAFAPILAETEKLAAAGKYREAAGVLAGFRLRQYKDVREQRGLQLACRVLKNGSVAELFAFVSALKDDILAEDCLEMTSAMGVVMGKGSDVWRVYKQAGLQPTERVALFRGLVAGVVAAESQPSRATGSAAQ